MCQIRCLVGYLFSRLVLWTRHFDDRLVDIAIHNKVELSCQVPARIEYMSLKVVHDIDTCPIPSG